jgi:DNA primase
LITQKSIQEVFDTARVEDVIGDFVQLKRAGVNMKGLCPFHDEKTPSFVVSPGKNIYKCFGCGKGGSPVQFVMEHENLSFPEAIRYLAGKYQIELEETQASEEEKAEKQMVDSLHLINEFAAEFYQDQLWNSNKGKNIGLSYFKERGFLEKTIREFGLGFAPQAWDAFTTKAVSAKYNIEYLRKLGLTTSSDRDFFRDRVIFPIHGLTGKVIAFAGRILRKDAKAPKYINSPESDVYHKSRILYGVYFAKNAMRKQDECILVEGYTDVISLYQAGIENVVASSGTSLTKEQVRLIKRFTPNIKLLYDGDKAGIKAALRGVDIVLEQDLNAKIVVLPDGEDPDSYLQKVGAKAFREYLEEKARDFIFFKTELLLEETGGDPVRKAALIRNIVESIALIPDPIKRAVYIKECARLMDMAEQALIDETNKLVTRAIQDKRKKKAREEAAAGKARPEGDIPEARESGTEAPTRSKISATEQREREIARILVLFGGETYDKEEHLSVAGFILSNIEEVLDEFDNVIYGRIARECRQLLLDKKPINRDHFVHHPDENIRKFAIDILSSPYEYSPNWEARWEIILQTQPEPDKNFERDSRLVLQQFLLQKFNEMCTTNSAYIQGLYKEGKEKEIQIYLKVQQELLSRRNAIAKELKRVIM